MIKPEPSVLKVGVNAAVIRDGQVLLTKRADFGVWCLPGGHTDAGESVAQAAVRETREETGLDVRLTRLVGIYSIPQTSAWSNLIILFTAEPIGGALKAQQGEVRDIRYFAPDDIPDTLLWGHRQRIQDALYSDGGGIARLQHVPFDEGLDRQALYGRCEESGLSGEAFYAQHFGWSDPPDDRLEVGGQVCATPRCVVVKGGGDLGTGVAWRLHRCGFRVLVTETERPTVIRRAVAFASAVYEGAVVVDGVSARLVEDDAGIAAAWEAGEVGVLVDPGAAVVERLRPSALVDAILAKRNLGTRITDAPVVVALGPGFTAGMDCHAVVETSRGHDLGRVILEGSAEPNTGVPGSVGGESARRVLRAPAEGIFRGERVIGDLVRTGEVVAYVDDAPLRSQLDGVVRGLLYDGLRVHAGMKVGDVDPRGVVSHCFSISDKALAIGGGVVEAILYLGQPKGFGKPLGS